MKTKDKVLNLLRANSNAYISGQEIAESLFMTRAAVWKAIKALRESGYEIEAVNNKGYCLVCPNEMLVEDIIRAELKPELSDYKLFIHDEVTSTNDYARNYYYEGRGTEFAVISDCQTKGRGRHGRVFFSPKGTGLYISLAITPNSNMSEGSLLVAMTAVAISKAISETLGIETDIKWVNDVFLNGKKVAGILTEAVTSFEAGTIECAIVGIGVNIYEPSDGFPDEIKKKAGALLPNNDADFQVKNKLAASIINHFYEYYLEKNRDFIKEYRSRSNILGNYIKITPTGKEDTATAYKGYAVAKEIDDECHLIVEYEDGKRVTLLSGEVSIVKY